VHLFSVTEPKNQKRRGPLEPGLVFNVEDDVAVVHLVTTGEYQLTLPLDKTLSAGAKQALQLAKATGAPRIYQADASRAEGRLQLVSTKDAHSREAIVLVATEAGEDGELKLTANTFRECLETERYGRHTHQQVTKVWNSFPPPGVELLNPEHAQIGEDGVCRWDPGVEIKTQVAPPILLRMNAGASFRVWRSGDICGAASNFLVSWSGKELWTVVPRNHDNHKRNGQ